MRTIMRLAVILVIVLFTACSSTKEVSTVTTETETIKPITFAVPEISGNVELPYIKPDDVLPEPYGNYENENIVLKNNGLESSIKIKAKLTRDKKNKPILIVDLNVKPDSIKKDAVVIKKNTNTQTKSETKIENPLKEITSIVKWIVIGIFLVVLIVVVGYVTGIYKKIFP